MAIRTACAAVVLLIAVLVLNPGLIDLTLPPSMMALLLGSMLLGGFGDLAFVRAVSIEDVSRVFTVSSALYILLSVAGAVIFMGEPFSILLVIGGIAVLFGTRLVVVDPGSASNAEHRGHARQPILALQLAIVAAFLWSAALLTISDALEDVDPLTAASLRLPFMALVLLAMTTLRGDMHLRSVSRRDFASLALSGSLVLGSMLLFLSAADLAPAGTVAVLSSTGPIFAVPMAHFLLKEHVTQRVLTGTIACMLGIFLASAA